MSATGATVTDITKRLPKRRVHKYRVLTETRCKAKTHYWKHWAQMNVKAFRDRQCSFYTVTWCGFCRRHCKELCGYDHFLSSRAKRGKVRP